MVRVTPILLGVERGQLANSKAVGFRIAVRGEELFCSLPQIRRDLAVSRVVIEVTGFPRIAREIEELVGAGVVTQ